MVMFFKTFVVNFTNSLPSLLSILHNNYDFCNIFPQTVSLFIVEYEKGQFNLSNPFLSYRVNVLVFLK